MYGAGDKKREVDTEEVPYRDPFRRDYARLLHSPSFRRLQGKTQLFPVFESDFFRNRLTHSLEVAQIAKTIAIRINSCELSAADKLNFQIDPDICEFAGMAHDLGHPPFGHQGEEALDECMRNYGGFEGNAQTLRILVKLEKKVRVKASDDISERKGLGLTYRSLASILKYDRKIGLTEKDRQATDLGRPIKGYYWEESGIVERIKQHVLGSSFGVYAGRFKTIECQIMDIADDIAYSTYDLEDLFKAGFAHPVKLLTYPEEVYDKVAQKVEDAINSGKEGNGKVTFTRKEVLENLRNIFSGIYNNLETNQVSKQQYLELANKTSLNLANDGYIRGVFTSDLIRQAVESVVFELNKKFPSQSTVRLKNDALIRVEVLKHLNYESQILSPRLKVPAFRGKEIVKTLFDIFSTPEGWHLLPADVQVVYRASNNPTQKNRCICDFISGMTDRYAIEFYGRLKSEKPETIFKPF